MSSIGISVRGPLTAVFRPDGDTMLDLKWPVIGVAMISLALIFNYDLRFGFAASALLVMLSVIYLWISFRLAPERGEPRSEREALFNRFSKLARNRQVARLKELGRQRGSD